MTKQTIKTALIAKADVLKNLHWHEIVRSTEWKHIWNSTNVEKWYTKRKGDNTCKTAHKHKVEVCILYSSR